MQRCNIVGRGVGWWGVLSCCQCRSCQPLVHWGLAATDNASRQDENKNILLMNSKIVRILEGCDRSEWWQASKRNIKSILVGNRMGAGTTGTWCRLLLFTCYRVLVAFINPSSIPGTFCWVSVCSWFWIEWRRLRPPRHWPNKELLVGLFQLLVSFLFFLTPLYVATRRTIQYGV